MIHATADEATIRADHVGSLIRPDALIAARKAAEAGEIAGEELARLQAAAIRDVVRLQETSVCGSPPTVNTIAPSGSATFC